MSNIVITGANGLVATEFINKLLLNDSEVTVYAVTTNIQKLKSRYSTQPRVVCVTLEDLEVKGSDIDAVINCAFARNAVPNSIAQSLDFARKIAEWAKANQAMRFINISSQSVYGKINEPMWTEETNVSPDYLYAMGKYATEQIVASVLSQSNVKFTNIRLSSVCERARFMNVFVKNVIAREPIKIAGGNQRFSFIDVRDVAEALEKVVKYQGDFEHCYNLGTGKNYSLLEIADIVASIADERFQQKVDIQVEPSDIADKMGMDNNLFCKTFDWNPKYEMKQMIESLFVLNGVEIQGGDVYSYTICYN